MRNKLAIVKNVVALQTAYESLAGRDLGVPGLCLVHGFTGAGKTTAIAWLVNRVRGVYLRACATWTPSAMLGATMKELGAEPLNRSAAMVAHIAQQLATRNRPLFVDEADYLFRDLAMLETLRDIHDVSGSPIVLIGMEGIEKRIVHRLQFSRRISQWVEFLPTDAEDARTLADTVCEVEVKDDALHDLHAEAKGSMGLMVVGLSRMESHARANSWKFVDRERWGNRPYFLSRAPKGRG